MFLTAKTAQALHHTQSALRLEPGHEPAMRLRKRVRDVDRLKDEGNAAFKAGRLDEATQKYGEALEVSGYSCGTVDNTNSMCRKLARKRVKARVVTYEQCFFLTVLLLC